MPPRYSHNRAKRSVLDDQAYEESLNYVSEKGRRFANRVIARHTRRDLGLGGVAGAGSETADRQRGMAAAADQLPFSLSMLHQQSTANSSSAAVAEGPTPIVIHDHIAVFAPRNANQFAEVTSNNGEGDNSSASTSRHVAPRGYGNNRSTAAASSHSFRASSSASAAEPLTPSQLLIKFIGYLPTRWLEAIVRAVETEHNRQKSVRRQEEFLLRQRAAAAAATSPEEAASAAAALEALLAAPTAEAAPFSADNVRLLLEADEDGDLLAMTGDAEFADAVEEEAQAILGLFGVGSGPFGSGGGAANGNAGDAQKMRSERRASQIVAQREATAAAVDALNSASSAKATPSSTSAAALLGPSSAAAGAASNTYVRSVPAGATPLHLLDGILSHKQREARLRAVATFGAVRAEQRRATALLEEQSVAINLNVKRLAEAEEKRRFRRRAAAQQQQHSRRLIGGSRPASGATVVSSNGDGGHYDDEDDDAIDYEDDDISSGGEEGENRNRNSRGGLSRALAAERERKAAHMALVASVEDRFRAAQLMAVIAHLVHGRCDEARAFVVLLRLFSLVAEGGLAEEGGWRGEAAAVDSQYGAARRKEQAAERSFMAEHSRSAMSIRDLLRRGAGGGAADSGYQLANPSALALSRSHIPSSAEAIASKWKFRFEQKRDAAMKAVVKDVIVPLLLGKDVGAIHPPPPSSSSFASTASPPPASSFPSSYALLASSALPLLFDLFPSQSDGRAATATAMSVVSASNALLLGGSSAAASPPSQSAYYGSGRGGGGGGGGPFNVLGGIPTTNLLHLGLLLDAEQGTGPVGLTDLGDEVRTSWSYVAPWSLQQRQEECLRLWQRFRPTELSQQQQQRLRLLQQRAGQEEGEVGGVDTCTAAEVPADPNADLLPTAAGIFKRLYYSCKDTSDPTVIAQSSLLADAAPSALRKSLGPTNNTSSSVFGVGSGADGFDPANTLHALLLCQQWAATVEDPDENEEFIPNNVFPPLRPFLSFPFHVTAQLSGPARTVLRDVLAPFVDNYWAAVATTSAAAVLAAKDARDERLGAAAGAAAAMALQGGSASAVGATDMGDHDIPNGSIFGPFVSNNNTPTKRNINNNNAANISASGGGGEEEGGDNEVLSGLVGDQSYVLGGPQNTDAAAENKQKTIPLTAKELAARRAAALAAKEAQRAADAAQSRQRAAERQRVFEADQQKALEKEAGRLAKKAINLQERTAEKEARLATLNDPIARARERLQREIAAAGQLYSATGSAITAPSNGCFDVNANDDGDINASSSSAVTKGGFEGPHERAAPGQMPPRADSPLAVRRRLEANADRSDDFNFVTNKVRRPLNERALEMRFLMGGGAGGAAASAASMSACQTPRGGGAGTSYVVTAGNTANGGAATTAKTYDHSRSGGADVYLNEDEGDEPPIQFVTVRRLVTVTRPKEGGAEGETEEVEVEIEEEVAEEAVTEAVARRHSRSSPKADNENKSKGPTAEGEHTSSIRINNLPTATAAASKNAIGFSYAPAAIASPLSPRNYAQHAFASDPYLAEAIAHLDASAAAAHSDEAAEAAATRKEAHKRAADAYHTRVMGQAVAGRLEQKLSARRAEKEKYARAAADARQILFIEGEMAAAAADISTLLLSVLLLQYYFLLFAERRSPSDNIPAQ